MKLNQLLVVVPLMLATTFLSEFAVAQSCGSSPGIGKVWLHGNSVMFITRVLNIDADGAPNSYRLDGKGLSYTCDGVAGLENGKRVTQKSNPRDWQQKCNAAWSHATATNDYHGVAIFGFETKANNKPVIQADGDPLPGTAYVSATSVSIPGTPDGTQRHYVDALKIPYVVLPSSFVSKYKVKPGGLAVVYRKSTKNYAYAVFADGGDLGEASVKLHQDLGGKPIVRINGTDRAKSRMEDQILIVVFPNKHAAPRIDSDEWNKQIKLLGNEALNEFGGIEQLQECAK
jgi:hypothetical protein